MPGRAARLRPGQNKIAAAQSRDDRLMRKSPLCVELRQLRAEPVVRRRIPQGQVYLDKMPSRDRAEHRGTLDHVAGLMPFTRTFGASESQVADQGFTAALLMSYASLPLRHNALRNSSKRCSPQILLAQRLGSFLRQSMIAVTLMSALSP